MKKTFITAIIIAKNEEKMIAACLHTLEWCQEVLVIDNGSVDKTVEVAEKLGAKVVYFKHQSFARVRNEALKHAKNDWVVYIDADERVSPTLAREISTHIEMGTAEVFSIRRSNFFYGEEVSYGGTQNDIVTRVFHKSALDSWFGDIHESPQYRGQTFLLNTSLIHFTHRDTISGLLKTAQWTPIEADLLADAKIQTITFKTILRKGVMEFFRRALKQQGYKDGDVGLIEALIQGINRALVYIQVWERQQKPSIGKKYEKKEREVAELWKAEKNKITK